MPELERLRGGALAIAALGANAWRRFLHVTVPGLRYVIIVAVRLPMLLVCPLLLEPDQVVLGLAAANSASFVIGAAIGLEIWQWGETKDLVAGALRLDDLSLAAGMLCAYASVVLALHPERVERKRWVFSLLMIAGIAGFWMLVRSCFGIAHDQKEWPEPWKVEHRTLVALAIGATALGSLFAFRLLQAVLANPVLLFLAAISYNLYLWHQPIARELLAHRLPPFVTADPHEDHAWQLAFAFVAIPVAIAVSALITYGFERPLLRVRGRPEGRAVQAAESGALA